MEDKEKKKQFVVYNSDKPLTFKQGQGHQTWYELAEPKQGYNNAKFQKPCLNSVHKKAKDKVFVKSGNTSVTSLEYVQKVINSRLFMTCLMHLTIQQSFNLI